MASPSPSAAPPAPGPVIITGHGRSGSNRVLDLFDCSAVTLCRNEPNEVPGSALAGLPDGFFFEDRGPDFEDALLDALAVAARSFSTRDRIGTSPKAWVPAWQRRVVGRGLLARGRLRGLLAPVAPGLAREEVTPGMLYGGARLDGAVPVFKILLSQGWLCGLLEARADFRVVHNIRDPHGFARSWWTRYLGPRDRARVFAECMVSVPRVLEELGGVPGDLSRPTDEALVEAEMWRWRYANEPLFVRYGDHPRYRHVLYAEASRDAGALARSLFAFAGLPYGAEERGRVLSMTNTMFATRPDVAPLDDAVLERVVQRVMDGSPLNALFDVDRRLAPAAPRAEGERRKAGLGAAVPQPG